MAESWIEKAAQRVDSWVNSWTGVGTNTGRTDFRKTYGVRFDQTTLENLFFSDAFAASIVEAVPEEAIRRGMTVGLYDATGANNDTWSANFATLWNAREFSLRMHEAWSWARLFGGGWLVLGCADGTMGDYAQPLRFENIESLVSVRALEYTEMQPQTWCTDPVNPNFGNIETYLMTLQGGASSTVQLVHHSRVIRFDGGISTRRRRFANKGVGESVLQRVYEPLAAFNGVYAGVATIVQDASQGVFKIKDLASMLAGDKTNTLKTRATLLDMTRSLTRSVMVDAETEDYKKVETNTLSGLPAVMQQFVLYLAGASQIPVTILMGQSPAGLNATSDTDVRNFYSRVKSQRVFYLEPRIRQLAKVMCAAKDGPTGGVIPSRIDIEWPSMWEQTDTEQAEMRETQSKADQVYAAIGASPQDIVSSRFAPNGQWRAWTKITGKVTPPQTIQAPAPGSHSPAAPAPQPVRTKTEIE